MKSKKGTEGIEWIFLIIAFSVGLLTWYTYYYLTPHKIIGNYVGEHQFSILKADNEAEKALFYIDQSAKYSLQQAVYDLAGKGGILKIVYGEEPIFENELSLPGENEECGNYYGYSMWHDVKKDESGSKINMYCIDEEKAKINLEYLFNEQLNLYLQNYPKEIRLDNYNYEIKDSLEMLGKAKSPLIFDILKDETIEVEKQPFETKIAEFPSKDFEDFTGTELCAKGSRCMLTKEAYELLEKAQLIAMQRDSTSPLEVYSGYRSIDEQKALWEGLTPEKYKQRFPEETIRAKYVCNPNNGAESCPHMTGNAVDIRFKGKTTKSMTDQDWQQLKAIMTQAGWVRYVKELWHYECCNTVRYAKAKNLEAKTGKQVTEIG